MEKVVVEVATSNTRGFLKNLLDYKYENIVFKYNDSAVYEISNRTREFLAAAIKMPAFDYFGVFQVVKAIGSDCDVYFSYNRFLKTDKPYVILLENPSALVNYCWERPEHLITKVRLKRLFSDPNLKGIICMSKACYNHLSDLYTLPNHLQVYQIYPFLLDDDSYFPSNIIEKTHYSVIECLYISSDFNLKGGCDIIEVCKALEHKRLPVHVTCITKIDSIQQNQKNDITKLNNISIVEFNLSKEELDEYYKRASILLNPTRFDSFSLVTLEAMKYGCALIAIDVYAIREMVNDGVNGFLGKPMYKVWDEDGKLNKYIRNHKNSTVYSGKIDKHLVEWMIDKLEMLSADRVLLESMCTTSLTMSRNREFSEEAISKKWSSILGNASKGKIC